MLRGLLCSLGIPPRAAAMEVAWFNHVAPSANLGPAGRLTDPAALLLLAQLRPGGGEVSLGSFGAGLLEGMEAAEGESIVTIEMSLYPVLAQPLTSDDRVLVDPQGLLDLLRGGGQGSRSLANGRCGGLRGVAQPLRLLRA